MREAEGTLTGHAAGQDTTPVLDHAAAVKAIGTGGQSVSRATGLPEPLASVVDYLGDDLDEREFVPTAELAEAIGVDANTFGRQMSELWCRPTRNRITGEDGRVRQARGYLTADLRAAIARADEIGSDDGTEADLA